MFFTELDIFSTHYVKQSREEMKKKDKKKVENYEFVRFSCNGCVQRTYICIA